MEVGWSGRPRGGRVTSSRGRLVGGVLEPLLEGQSVGLRVYSCLCSCPLCVGALCTRGPIPRAHMWSQPCAKHVLFYPASSCLEVYWASHYLVGQSVAILIHVTSDPELACLSRWGSLLISLLCVGMCDWMHEQDFLCPWWQVCVFACVF